MPVFEVFDLRRHRRCFSGKVLDADLAAKSNAQAGLNDSEAEIVFLKKEKYVFVEKTDRLNFPKIEKHGATADFVHILNRLSGERVIAQCRPHNAVFSSSRSATRRNRSRSSVLAIKSGLRSSA